MHGTPLVDMHTNQENDKWSIDASGITSGKDLSRRHRDARRYPFAPESGSTLRLPVADAMMTQIEALAFGPAVTKCMCHQEQRRANRGMRSLFALLFVIITVDGIEGQCPVANPDEDLPPPTVASS